MTRVFEDEFMEYQEDMVAIAKEFIDDRAEKIYLYGSIEVGRYFFNLFFKINNKVVFMSQVNSVLPKGMEVNVSDDRQDVVLHTGLKDLQNLEKVCKKYGKEVPIQLKLFYDVKNNSLKAKYQYDLLAFDDIFDTQDIFMSWYDEIKKEVEG